MSTFSYEELSDFDCELMQEIEEEDNTRIIKILLRMHPYFTVEDLQRYRLLNYVL